MTKNKAKRKENLKVQLVLEFVVLTIRYCSFHSSMMSMAVCPLSCVSNIWTLLMSSTRPIVSTR